MRISLDEGFFLVVMMRDGSTVVTHKGGTFVKQNASFSDLEVWAKEFNASPWIMYEDQ